MARENILFDLGFAWKGVLATITSLIRFTNG